MSKQEQQTNELTELLSEALEKDTRGQHVVPIKKRVKLVERALRVARVMDNKKYVNRLRMALDKWDMRDRDVESMRHIYLGRGNASAQGVLNLELKWLNRE